METDTLIRFEFTPGFGDFLRFQRSFARRALRRLRPFAILSLICYLLAPLMPYQRNSSPLESYVNYLGALFLPGLIWIWIPFFVYLTAKKRWKAAADLREPRIYEFSDTGLSMIARTSEGTTKWQNIRRAETVGPTMLLFNTQDQAYIIPIDAIGVLEKVEYLKSLIRAKVPDSSGLR